MASQQEAEQAIIDRIVELAPKAQPPHLLLLAEALAWCYQPGQPHGGHHTDK